MLWLKIRLRDIQYSFYWCSNPAILIVIFGILMIKSGILSISVFQW